MNLRMLSPSGRVPALADSPRQLEVWRALLEPYGWTVAPGRHRDDTEKGTIRSDLRSDLVAVHGEWHTARHGAAVEA